MELQYEIYNALIQYYSVLFNLGYKAYNQIPKLLVLTFLDDILYGPMSYYVTNDDYAIINEVMNNFYGTCLIPYPDYKTSISNDIDVEYQYRVSQSDILRVTEDNIIRFKS